MMMQIVDKPNTTSTGQDRKTLTSKDLLYLNVAVHVQVCRLFCVVYIPLFSLVTAITLYMCTAITYTFLVNQIISYSGVLAITKTPL